jgi:hypothetical protein
MNDAFKIALLVIVRHCMTGISVLLGYIGMTKDETDAFLNPELLGAIVLALLSLGSGYYSRAASKLKQKLALLLPANTSEARLTAEAKKQPFAAKLSTNPKA